MMRARATLAVIGTLPEIADTLVSADVDDADLYLVADALQAARNAVLAAALDRVALREGREIAACYRAAPSNGRPSA